MRDKTARAKEALAAAYIKHMEKGKAEGLNKALRDAVQEAIKDER